MIHDGVTLHPEWKIIYEQFYQADYGTFIPHEDIERIIGIRRSQRYYNFVNRWKTEMIKKARRYIECENGKGYRVVLPEEFKGSAKRQFKLGHKRIRKAGEIVVKAPMELLADDERKKLEDLSIVISQVIYFNKESLTKIKQIDVKPDKLMLELNTALEVAD